MTSHAEDHAKPGVPRFQQIESCPLCRSPSFDVIRIERHHLPPQDAYFSQYRDDDVRLKRCRACFFAYADKLPADPLFFEKIYSSYKPDFSSEMTHHGKRAIFRSARKALSRHGYDRGTLLDVGCWVGHFLREMSDTFQTRGVELNRFAAEYGILEGLSIEIGSFHDALLPEDHFDVVSFIDVLEHLPEPGEVLLKATRILKRSGAIYIKVPNYLAQIGKQAILNQLGVSKQGIMANYVHINHFTRQSLGNHLSRLGYEILETGFTGPELWDLRRDPKPMVFASRLVRNLSANAITAASSALSRVLSREMGFNLYVLARKG